MSTTTHPTPASVDLDAIHLTVLTFAPHHPIYRWLHASPEMANILVGRCVQDTTEDTDARWLYHQSTAQDGTLTLTIQSPLPIRWPQADPLPTSLTTQEITAFLNTLKTGEQLEFSLLAAPRRRLRATKKNVSLTTEEERRDWLAQALTTAADLLTVKLQPPFTITMRRRVTTTMVLYTGLLRITDPQALWDLVADGVGPNKSSGAGLLRLQRPSQP